MCAVRTRVCAREGEGRGERANNTEREGLRTRSHAISLSALHTKEIGQEEDSKGEGSRALLFLSASMRVCVCNRESARASERVSYVRQSAAA